MVSNCNLLQFYTTHINFLRCQKNFSTQMKIVYHTNEKINLTLIYPHRCILLFIGSIPHRIPIPDMLIHRVETTWIISLTLGSAPQTDPPKFASLGTLTMSCPSTDWPSGPPYEYYKVSTIWFPGPDPPGSCSYATAENSAKIMETSLNIPIFWYVVFLWLTKYSRQLEIIFKIENWQVAKL